MLVRKALAKVSLAAAIGVAATAVAAGGALAQSSGDGSNAAALSLKEKIEIAQDRNIPISAITDGAAHRWLQEKRAEERQRGQQSRAESE